MFRSISFSVRWIALLSMVCSVAGFAQQPAHTLPKWVHAAPPPQQKKYLTPAERHFIPFLRAHAKPTAFGAGGPRPLDSTNGGVPTPNFAGYGAAPAYAGRTNYDVTSGTQGSIAEVTADFNKDGKPDVAVLQENGTLNIMLNDGKGGLLAPVAYANPNFMGTYAFNTYAVDVNGDGYPDIVAYDEVNNNTITWLNLGNGTFNAAVTTPLDTTNGYPIGIYSADVNGDGKADLLFVTAQQSTASTVTITLEVQLGAGDGTFGTAAAAKVQQFSVNAPSGVGQPSIDSVIVADFNGDGKPDIAVSLAEYIDNSTGQYVVTTALGNGDGTFSPLGVVQPISIPVILSAGEFFLTFDSTGVFVGDVDGNGKLDVVSDINGVVATALGTGSGTFSPAVTSTPENVNNLAQMLLADVNGDGKLDLVEVGETLAISLGNGDGTFNAELPGNQWVIDPSGFLSIVAADFNGDGITDVAQMGGTTGDVSLFFGNGKNLTGAPDILVLNDPNAAHSELVASGNYTASGFMSPLFLYGNPSTGAFSMVTNVSDGKGNFTSVPSLAAGVPADLEFVEPIKADFNGDGLDDLLYANASGDLMIALAKGDGTFGTPVSIGLPSAACTVYYAAAGDINGDGKMDLVIPYGGDQTCGASGSGVSGYYVALGKGDGTFAAPVFTATGTELYSATLADVNNDGNLDLILNDAPLVYGSGFQINVALGHGDGTFSDSTVVLQNYEVTNVTAGDINNDGKVDLVMSTQEVEGTTLPNGTPNYATAGILLMTGNGDGSFNPPSQIASGNWYFGLQLADVNNDGNTDILATFYSTLGLPNQYTGFVTLLGYGNGQFAPPVDELEDNSSSLPIPGHFVNDGAVDVMTSTPYGGGLFLGQGGSTLTLGTSASSIVFGQAVTLTATLTVSLPGRPAATGTVSFYDGSLLLGNAPLSSSKATYVTTSLASGTHKIKAVYTGDSNFNPNTSATSTITVATLVPAFSLSASTGSLAVEGGEQGIATLTLSANATFNGTVMLTCSGMPTNGTCSINPGSVALTATGTRTATLVIGTTGLHASLQPRSTSPWDVPAGVASLATLLGAFFGRRKRIRSLAILLFGLLLSAGGLLTGCSDGGNDKTSAPTVIPGTYPLTITATANGNSANLQTASVIVTVN